MGDASERQAADWQTLIPAPRDFFPAYDVIMQQYFPVQFLQASTASPIPNSFPDQITVDDQITGFRHAFISHARNKLTVSPVL
jgi:hypothetical protein